MRARSSTAEAPVALHSLIALLRPEAVLSKIVSGRGRWSVRFAPYEEPAFCIVLDGSCFLDLDRVGVLELEQGDFVLLPATPGFVMASDLGMRPKPVSFAPHARETRHGDRSGPPTMRMLGGYFRFDRANAQLLVRLLPSAIHVRRDEPGAQRLRRVVELIAEEANGSHPAREMILERLIQVLLIEALRFRRGRTAREERGLLAGLSDPALAKPLRGIHDDMARRWTVAELARAAGMSRAVFAERFARTVGMPPMQYLLEWRMAIARDILRRERVSLAEVAERVGYRSASAFSTAFARHAGVSPSEFARASIRA